MSQYVKVRGDYHIRRHQLTLLRYYCNLSERYGPKNKIGFNCPAAMFVKISSAGKYRCNIKSAVITFLRYVLLYLLQMAAARPSHISMKLVQNVPVPKHLNETMRNFSFIFQLFKATQHMSISKPLCFAVSYYFDTQTLMS